MEYHDRNAINNFVHIVIIVVVITDAVQIEFMELWASVLNARPFSNYFLRNIDFAIAKNCGKATSLI